MSDLQCAATLLVVPAGQARAAAGTLARVRVAYLWSAATDRTRQAAELLAADLGVALATRTDLDDTERLETALGEIADEHRGETVLVVVSEGDEITEVVIDGDGRVRRRWAPPPPG